MSNTPNTPGPSDGNYQIFPFFPGTAGQCKNDIYLLPPTFAYGAKTSISIPLLYASKFNDQPPPPRNHDFQFSLSQDGSGPPTQANVNVNITLTGKNMWACSKSARTALMAHFVDFLEYIETHFESEGVLIAGATFRIGQIIADYLPAPLQETLFYRYSFSPGFAANTAPYVDVRPGMRLRVETQSSQFLTPGSALNGYVNGGSSVFFVNSVPAANGTNGARAVTFDPFLGTIRTPTITDASTSPVVAGGLIDLAPTGGARTYWRLFYPQSMPAPSQPGDLTTAHNMMLIGAQTLKQLNAATKSYSQCGDPGAPGDPPNVTVIFLGRAIAVPEIPVWMTVRGQTILQYVPLGTTIANLVERYTRLPLSPSQSVIRSISRTAANLTSDGTTSFPASDGTTSFPVSLTDNISSLTAIPVGFFDLPLIGGDNITLNF
jgi:hypothetical protein